MKQMHTFIFPRYKNINKDNENCFKMYFYANDAFVSRHVFQMTHNYRKVSREFHCWRRVLIIFYKQIKTILPMQLHSRHISRDTRTRTRNWCFYRSLAKSSLRGSSFSQNLCRVKLIERCFLWGVGYIFCFTKSLVS